MGPEGAAVERGGGRVGRLSPHPQSLDLAAEPVASGRHGGLERTIRISRPGVLSCHAAPALAAGEVDSPGPEFVFGGLRRLDPRPVGAFRGVAAPGPDARAAGARTRRVFVAEHTAGLVAAGDGGIGVWYATHVLGRSEEHTSE